MARPGEGTSKGKFIVLEGIGGSGKSTQIAMLSQRLGEDGVDTVTTREPGGTKVGERLRRIILDAKLKDMTPLAELLVMFAARAEHVEKVIRPALREGRWVLCDRFTDSTYAYQGRARGIGGERIATLEGMVQGELRPDLVIVLDLPAREALERVEKRKHGDTTRPAGDRFDEEGLRFYEQVRQGYLQRVCADPSRYVTVDAKDGVHEVGEQVWAATEELKKGGNTRQLPRGRSSVENLETQERRRSK